MADFVVRHAAVATRHPAIASRLASPAIGTSKAIFAGLSVLLRFRDDLAGTTWIRSGGRWAHLIEWETQDG